jgi:Zn-dependent peptidase ImmA (M78 family)
MFDLPSKSDIEKISLDLLKQSKSLDVFPTPVDSIVKYANLHFESGIDLSVLDQSFISKLSDKVSQKYLEAIGLVRGFIDRREKIIYLDLSQQVTRQNFVKLHEVGHDALYWQKDILDHLDNDATLNPYTKEEFEAEANYFASSTIFQQDRFENEMKKLELGIKAPMHLAKYFGASNHASLRKYVECSKKRCGLIVLEKISQKGDFPQCSKKDFFQSLSFNESFGTIELPEKFGYTWQFAQDYYNCKRYHENGMICLITENGEVEFQYHFFNNTFNAFVFLFPKGEINKTRTKIVISNNY